MLAGIPHGWAATAPTRGVYPNPVIDVLTVHGATEVRSTAIVITDMTGKRVMEGTLLNGQVQVSNLTSGVFVLSVVMKGQVVQHQFTKL